MKIQKKNFFFEDKPFYDKDQNEEVYSPRV